MIPLPYGRHFPSSASTSSPPEAISSAASRDLPTPGSPTIVTIRHDAVGDDPLELRQQRLQLRDAPNKRGIHPPRHTRHVRRDVEQQPRIDRLRLPLQLQRRHRLDRDRVTNKPDRRVTNKDLPGCRGRLEPLRNNNGIAGRKRITLRRITRVDLARMHSRPHTDPNPERRLEFVVQELELAAQLDRGTNRAQRVILVHDRNPKNTKNGVTDELLHRPTMTLQHRPRSLVIARPNTPERLRVQ